MTPTLRLVVADDHVLVRDAIIAHLEAIDDFEVVGRAADGDEALRLMETLRPDVAVVDISMPRRNGLRVARRAAQEGLGVAIVLLTAAIEPAVFAEAQRFGVLGFALKSDALGELEGAIRAAARGVAFVAPAVSTTGSPAMSKGLTPRELEVVCLTCQGLTSSQVGTALSISHRTVETHRHRAMRKLAVGSTVELVRLSIELGWVSS